MKKLTDNLDWIPVNWVAKGMLGIYIGVCLLGIVSLMSCSVRIGPKVVTHHGIFVAASYEDATAAHKARLIVVIEVVDGFTKELYKKVLTATQGYHPIANFDRLWSIYYLAEKGYYQRGDKVAVEFQE